MERGIYIRDSSTEPNQNLMEQIIKQKGLIKKKNKWASEREREWVKQTGK